MTKPTFLADSLAQLKTLTLASYSPEAAPIANAIWEKHLQTSNPLWKYLTAKPFSTKTSHGSAHIIAMIDKRLPNQAVVGYFACTNNESGTIVIKEAVDWLRQHVAIKAVYGPINGTATSDYRLNLDDDYWYPGEPINPKCQIKAFQDAGFTISNRYVSGEVKHYRLYSKLFVRIPKPSETIKLRPFNSKHQLSDLSAYHELMTTIFPKLSVYCPPLSWQERVYNFKDKTPLFDSRYCYFLEDQKQPIGLIIAYVHDNRLIIKTVGLLSEYRGRNLSNILVMRALELATEDNLDSVIYAMVRVGNAAYKKKRPGLRLVRRYVTMKLDLISS